MNLKPGTLLQGGRYVIIDTLGQGGFGITYLAEQVLARRKVCIKEFFPKEYYNRDSDSCNISLGSQSNAETMGKFKVKFIKEAQTIASLDHAHIIHIHDVFEENDTAYYVMEYIEGTSLSDMVKVRGALSEADAVRYIKEIASALGYIHEQKINHLDVKPGNIMVRTKGDSAILIDFGLSKHYDDTGGQTSSTPAGISHGYAPMEQYNIGGVSSFSPATDIYSLGATLHYLVSGVTPPAASVVGEDGIGSLPTHLSRTTCQAIERAMSYWRKDRPQSIDEFLALLGNTSVEAKMSALNESTQIVGAPNSNSEATVFPAESKDNNDIISTTAECAKSEKAPAEKRGPKHKGLWITLSIIFGIFIGTSVYMLLQDSTEGFHKGHHWVDLGLPSKTKWSSSNIYATGDDMAGSAFEFGVADEDESYRSYSNYHDAATELMGDGWKVPTKEQFEELIEYCDWTWEEGEYIDNAVFIRGGYRVTGPNGNSIRLVATEHREDEDMVAYQCDSLGYAAVEAPQINFIGDYWTSSSTDYNQAYSLHFEHSDDISSIDIVESDKDKRCSIRAVFTE